LRVYAGRGRRVKTLSRGGYRTEKRFSTYRGEREERWLVHREWDASSSLESFQITGGASRRDGNLRGKKEGRKGKKRSNQAVWGKEGVPPRRGKREGRGGRLSRLVVVVALFSLKKKGQRRKKGNHAQLPKSWMMWSRKRNCSRAEERLEEGKEKSGGAKEKSSLLLEVLLERPSGRDKKEKASFG